MYRNKQFWIFSAVALVALLLLNLPNLAASRLKLALGGVFLPLFGVTQSSDRLLEKVATATVPKTDLVLELDRLRKTNQELSARAMQTQEIWRENERLRQLLAHQKQQPWKMRMAHVIGRDPANWWRMVHLDVGEREGVRPNLAVITAEGLVGRIAETGPTFSKAVLLGDPKCRVSAAIPDAKDSGVISAGTAGVWDHNYVVLGYLSRGNDLKPGQSVFTSGLGGVFPKGILVGQVLDLRSVDALYLEARVKLAANLSSLEEVWIVLQ